MTFDPRHRRANAGRASILSRVAPPGDPPGLPGETMNHLHPNPDVNHQPHGGVISGETLNVQRVTFNFRGQLRRRNKRC
jgi:hypothetical protein